MVEYLRDEVRKIAPRSFDYYESESYQFPDIRRLHEGSLAYSWDVGNVHFFQLQNYPTYQREWEAYNSADCLRKIFRIKPCLSWLRRDLTAARNEGRAIVLNYHTPGYEGDDREFSKMLSEFKVSVIFVGHVHPNIGRRPADDIGRIPLFYCGAASQSTYLRVRFSDDHMNVDRVSSLNGQTQRTPDVNPELGYSSNIHPLHAPLPETPLPDPPEDGWVTFFNEAGYVYRCKLTDQLDGVTIEKETGRMALGNKIRYEIPGGATQVRVMGEGETGLAWDWWRVTFDKSYDTPPQLCFKSFGATLKQHWNNACT